MEEQSALTCRNTEYKPGFTLSFDADFSVRFSRKRSDVFT